MAILKSMNDAQLAVQVEQWESNGFSFFGSVQLPNDDDSPCSCPNCDYHGYYTALWENESQMTNSINRCYRCGHQWVEVEADGDALTTRPGAAGEGK